MMVKDLKWREDPSLLEFWLSSQHMRDPEGDIWTVYKATQRNSDSKAPFALCRKKDYSQHNLDEFELACAIASFTPDRAR